MSSLLLDRIFPPRMEGMALHQSDRGQAQSMERTISSHRIRGILRTSRLKSARTAEKRRNQDPVALNDVQTQPLHLTQTPIEASAPVAGKLPTSASTPPMAGESPPASGTPEGPALGSTADAAVSRAHERLAWPDCAGPHSRIACLPRSQLDWERHPSCTPED